MPRSGPSSEWSQTWSSSWCSCRQAIFEPTVKIGAGGGTNQKSKNQFQMSGTENEYKRAQDILNGFNPTSFVDGSFCAQCQEPIIDGEFLSLADGQQFHVNCFNCDHCKKSLGTSFLSRDGKRYHQNVGNLFCMVGFMLIVGSVLPWPSCPSMSSMWSTAGRYTACCGIGRWKQIS